MRGLIAPKASASALLLVVVLIAHPAFAANQLRGRVEAARRSIVDASVTLWQIGPGGPRKISETRTKGDGRFELASIGEAPSADGGVFYLIAEGGELDSPTSRKSNTAIKLDASKGRILGHRDQARSDGRRSPWLGVEEGRETADPRP